MLDVAGLLAPGDADFAGLGQAFDLFAGDSSITALCDTTQASAFGVGAGIPGNTRRGLVLELDQMAAPDPSRSRPLAQYTR